MFNAISWQDYWAYLALLSTTYYLLILLLFYRKEISSRLLPKKLSATGNVSSPLFEEGGVANAAWPPSDFDEKRNFHEFVQSNEEPAVYACLDEFTAFFEEAKRQKWNRQQLLSAIRNILSKYPTLVGSDYQETVGRFISTYCEQYCSIHLKDEDRLGLW